MNKSNHAKEMGVLKERWGKEGLSHAEKAMRQIKLIYDEGKRPLQIWKAIDVCHMADMPLPDWVTDSLVIIARNLLSIDNSGKKKVPQFVFEAIGVEAREFTDLRRAKEDLELSLAIEQKHREKYGIGTKTLKKAREEYAKKVGEKYEKIERDHRKINSNPFHEDLLSHYLDKGGT